MLSNWGNASLDSSNLIVTFSGSLALYAFPCDSISAFRLVYKIWDSFWGNLLPYEILGDSTIFLKFSVVSIVGFVFLPATFLSFLFALVLPSADPEPDSESPSNYCYFWISLKTLAAIG